MTDTTTPIAFWITCQQAAVRLVVRDEPAHDHIVRQHWDDGWDDVEVVGEACEWIEWGTGPMDPEAQND